MWYILLIPRKREETGGRDTRETPWRVYSILYCISVHTFCLYSFPIWSPHNVLCLKCSLEETGSAQFILDHYLEGECFQDEENSRILPHNAMDDKTNKKMTLELCFFLCFDENEYLYAGVQNGKECWCGNVKPKTPSPKYECDVPCGGDPSQNCGAEG